MSNITYRVAPRGEGKTKWLLDIAQQYANEGRETYYYTTNHENYSDFCEKYFKQFFKVCPVQLLKGFKLNKDSVVLIDNLLDQDTTIADLKYMHDNSYAMYVTLDGKIGSDIIQNYPPVDFEQLSFFNNCK